MGKVKYISSTIQTKSTQGSSLTKTCYLFWEIPRLFTLLAVQPRLQDTEVFISQITSAKRTQILKSLESKASHAFDNYPPRNKHSPSKMPVEKLFSFWDVNFSGDMLVVGRVYSWGDLKYFTIQSNTWSFHWISISWKIIISITNCETLIS